MTRIQLSPTSGVPVFRQIVDQLAFMVEAGQLEDGDRLPSARMLAANLHINRNTVARAYAELREQGYVRPRGRAGMVIAGAMAARGRQAARAEAQAALQPALERCLALGLTADEIASLAYHQSLQAGQLEIQLTFVECNAERAAYFSHELTEELGQPVVPLVLDAVEPAALAEADLVITTFFHLAAVRRLTRAAARDGKSPEVVGIVVAPHIRTLVRLAQVPKGHRIGIVYSTPDQAELIRRSLVEAGLAEIEVLPSPAAASAERVDLVVVPSENPELRAAVDVHIPTVEFGNVLDAASVRMLADVLDDLKDRKRSA